MIDRLRVLVEERAAEMAAHDGAPVGRAHIVGAVHYLTGLLAQAGEQALDGHRSLPAKTPIVAPAIEPVPEPPSRKRARK